jgi:hypothetical protein
LDALLAGGALVIGWTICGRDATAGADLFGCCVAEGFGWTICITFARDALSTRGENEAEQASCDETSHHDVVKSVAVHGFGFSSLRTPQLFG